MNVIELARRQAKTYPLLLALSLLYFGNAPFPSQTASLSAVTRPQLVLQTGHAMRVDGLAFSPDGQLLATASADNSIRLWDIRSNRELRTLVGHVTGVKGVAFSPDGRLLASGSIDGTIKLWDVSTGEELRSTSGNGSITALSFSSDGRSLAIGNVERTIRLFDAANGDLLHTLTGHSATITTLAFSPDNKTLASGSADKTISVWDVRTGTNSRTLSHSGKISAIVFSNNNKVAASASIDGTIKIWQPGAWREQRSIKGPEGVLALAFSSDLTSVVAATADNMITRWSVLTGREGIRVAAPGGSNVLQAISMAFSPDARRLAVSTGDKTVQIRNAETGQELGTLSTHSYGVYAATFSRDGKWFASGGKENTVKLWELATGRELFTLDPNGGFVNGVVFSPDSKLLAAGALSGGITLWDVESGVQTGSLQGHSSSVNALAFSPDGKWLASASADQTVKIWDVATRREIRTCSGHSREVYALAFAPDGRLLASGSADKTIKIWNPLTGNEKTTLKGHTGEVSAIVFNPDGKSLVSAGEDKTIRIWDVAAGRETRLLSGHERQIKALAVSPDGQQFASGSADTTVRLWDTATGRETRSLGGHSSEIYTVAFSPDAHWLASGSDDGSVRIWDVRTGTAVATLISLRENVGGLSARRTDWLVVAPDGLFDGSPGSWNQILWRFEGNTQNVRPVEVFFNEFFHPGLLADVLADRSPKAPQDVSEIDRRQPQVVLTLADKGITPTKVSTRDLPVRIEVTASGADKEHSQSSGVRDVRLFRNGALARVWRGELVPDKDNRLVLETTIPIVAGDNELTAYAFNRANIKSADSRLTVVGAASLKRPASAYIIALGVNTYANPGYNLKLAVPDANDFSAELRRSQQSLLGQFTAIEVVPLLDEEATKANILLALERLSGLGPSDLPEGVPPQLAKLKPAQPEDTVVIFFAGHGLANKAQFYLLPHDLGYQGSRRRLNLPGLQSILSHSISDRELEQSFEKLQAGQILLVLDACNSGQALEAEEKRRGPMNSKGLAQLAYEKGMYILTAAQSYQAALEVAELGHGLLTYALVEEGLKKALADTAPRDGRVLLQEWLDFATARVPELQQTKMREGQRAGSDVAFVEGDEQLRDVEKRDLQRPRVFYRRDTPVPVIAIHSTSQK